MIEEKKNMSSHIRHKTPAYGDYQADYQTGEQTGNLIQINSLESPG